jgi:hypothetical protein
MMGCNEYHMIRENPDLFDQFKKLNIEEDKKTEWAVESFLEYRKTILNHRRTDKFKVVNKYFYMVKLLRQTFSNKAYTEVLNITTKLLNMKLTYNDKIFVASVIVGHSNTYNDLVYYCIQRNMYEEAKSFVGLALTVVKNNKSNNQEETVMRIKRRINELNEIIPQ